MPLDEFDEYLIIDGYNVINAWPNLIKLKEVNFEHARLKLIDIASNYSGFKSIKVIIVFDAHQVKGGVERREYVDGVEVIYSQEGVTADMVIEKLIESFPKDKKVFVATSDRIEQEVIWGKGAYRISARELLHEIEETFRENHAYHHKAQQHKPYRLDAHLDDDVREILEKWRRGKQ
ncbi:MAG: NYN domain-containing protein [Clostridia bacterium]|nr:NYN domain-containing protein [Clostridia bacterium]